VEKVSGNRRVKENKTVSGEKRARLGKIIPV